MARIRFNEVEWTLGTVIAVALIIALLVAAIAFGWEHHQKWNHGNPSGVPSSELRAPMVGPVDLSA